MTEQDCDRLDLLPQAPVNTSVRGTPFTISIDGHPKHGLTTGVSARERAKTIQLMIDPSTTSDDFVRPGHINPLRSRDGGVLVRIGQTEGSLDLCRLAGLYPAACIIEIMGDDGEMLHGKPLQAFCKAHDIKVCSVRQIIEHRLAQSQVIEHVEPRAGQEIQTPFGPFRLHIFKSLVDPLPHLALTLGEVGIFDEDGLVAASAEPTLVRVRRRDLLGDIFDCIEKPGSPSTGDTLRSSMGMIRDAGRGAIIYLRPSNAGSDLSTKLTTLIGPEAIDRPQQSVASAMLEYGVGSQILRALGLSRLRLITNSMTAYPQLSAFGLDIVERVPVSVESTAHGCR